MTIFDRIASIHSEIDTQYSNAEWQARVRNHSNKEKLFQEKRQQNDMAYFLFMFTRLEDRITQLSNNLIDQKKSSLATWNHKRAWGIIDKDRMHFLARVALLTDKGAADYQLIKSYYDQRNSIAHGGNFSITISISTVVTDLNRLYREL